MAVDRAQLADELVQIIADDADQANLPRRLCQVCVAALPVDGVGISLMLSGDVAGRSTLGASDDVAARIEELQFTLGEGPCVSAFGDGQPVLVPDVRSTDARSRWPVFTGELEVLACGALFAFPLRVGTIGIGVLDCHRTRIGSLPEIDEALLVADVLTVALLDFQARDGTASDGIGDLFDVSWQNHAEVHQATGMVASQLDCTTEAAFARLRAHAFRYRMPLTEVANDVLGRRLRFSKERE